MRSELIKACADLFGVPPADLISAKRVGATTEAPFALYKALHMRGMGYSAIGRFLGRNHASVLHGVRVAEELMRDHPAYALRVRFVAAWQPERVSVGGEHRA